MLLGPALSESLRATTPETLRAIGTQEAIVIGGGASGGMAALLLAEAGLRVLVLDAGLTPSPLRSAWCGLAGGMARRLSRSYLDSLPPALAYLGRQSLKFVQWRHSIQSRCYAWSFSPEVFVDDIDCPYVTPADRPFVWLRARVLGGRMVINNHGRQYYRLGPDDFAPADQLSPPWPLQLGELDPWYALVERRLELSGSYDGLAWLPDSELSHLLEPTPTENALRLKISSRWSGAKAVVARTAPPLDALEAAALTGRLLCRRGAIVRKINVDSGGHVRGVVWLDLQTGTEQTTHAPLIFLCASALESTRLLLLSRSPRSPEGLGAASGVLGRCLMDHIKVIAEGEGPPLLPAPRGETERCLYLPRFDTREFSRPGPGKGFGLQLYQSTEFSRSNFVAASFGEMLPRLENRVTLSHERRDAWGIPVLQIDCAHDDADLIRAREQASVLRELAEVVGFKITRLDDAPAPPGSANHECGTARMGNDPATSVLDPHNQCWEAKGLYLTDGACFPSQGTQNPTLTILALTARACDHAIRSASTGRKVALAAKKDDATLVQCAE
jgi:choline dehydrogenase-like flavoprotein